MTSTEDDEPINEENDTDFESDNYDFEFDSSIMDSERSSEDSTEMDDGINVFDKDGQMRNFRQSKYSSKHDEMQLKKQNSIQFNAKQTREILQYELAKKNDENNKLMKKVQQQCAQYATLQEENVKLNDKIISGNDDGVTRENEN